MNHKFFMKSVLCAGIAGVTLVVSSATFAAVPTSIFDSYHNLGSTNNRTTSANGGTTPNHSTATGEICVFCHTPHGAVTNAAVPLWNRVLPSPTTYQRYSDLATSSFDAAEAPIGSVSIACLSCHDGTTAMDSVINRPGSGGYNAAGSPIGGFTGSDQTNGTLAAGIVQNLTQDLRDDHPVSMQYGGGGVNLTTPGGPTVDRDFPSAGQTHPRSFTLNNMPGSGGGITRLWWIERNDLSLNNGGRDRADVILYSRSEATVTGGEQPFVECGSCHDPHNINNPTFLRVSNGIPTTQQGDYLNPVDPNYGSALCLTCHIK